MSVTLSICFKSGSGGLFGQLDFHVFSSLLSPLLVSFVKAAAVVLSSEEAMSALLPHNRSSVWARGSLKRLLQRSRVQEPGPV